MSIEFLSDLMIPVIVGVCLCIGYLIKSWEKVPNKFIPTILGVIGVTVAVWLNGWTTSPEIILQGLISGLGSCGLYDAFKHLFIEGDKNGK